MSGGVEREGYLSLLRSPVAFDTGNLLEYLPY